MYVCCYHNLCIKYGFSSIRHLIESFTTLKINFPRYFRVPKHFDLLSAIATVNDKCLPALIRRQVINASRGN